MVVWQYAAGVISANNVQKRCKQRQSVPIVAGCKILNPTIGNDLKYESNKTIKTVQKYFHYLISIQSSGCTYHYLCTCSSSLLNPGLGDFAFVELLEGERKYMIWEKHVSRSLSNSFRLTSYTCEFMGVWANPTPSKEIDTVLISINTSNGLSNLPQTWL